MAIPTCIKCGGTSFEMVRVDVRHSNFDRRAIQCATCGGVVSIVPDIETNLLLGKQNKIINKMAIQMGIHSDLPTD